MNALITLGCKTTHGGTVTEADSSFLVDGKAVHLEGMSHYCPLCKTTSKAISSGQGFMMVGTKTIIMASDKATCGAVFIPNQNLVLRVSGSGSSIANIASLLANIGSMIKFSESFVLVDQETNEILANTPYKIHRKDGSIVDGVTDDKGLTQKIQSDDAEDISIEIVMNQFDV